MEQQAIMDYLTSAFGRMRLKLQQISPGDSLEEADFGLRAMLGLREEYASLERTFFRLLEQRMVYKLMDPFECNYIFFALPEEPERRTVLIGPYMTADRSAEAVLELTERMGLPMQYARQLADYYASIPVFEDTSMLMALVSAMGETLWGSVDAFETVDLNMDSVMPLPMPADATDMEENQLAMQIKYIEARYDYENQLIETVSRGLIQRVESITAGISQLNFEQRMADPLRNLKNYCIICNTLLRKAAEQGGVHPLHVDRMSSKYALLIENKGTPEGCSALIGDMCRSYCRLVRTHAISHYSAHVQKALLYMEENLSGDLSLQTLADMLALTPAYLSELFHRETGQTLVQHITELRMKHALHLLKTTRLQVQNVAQLCGVPDANYFSKLFRRQYGVTPRQFRQSMPPV